MAKFRKGQPRPKGAGRRPGSRNLLTRDVKAVFEATFAELQADPHRNLLAWATQNVRNLRHFYQIAARFIPLVEINVAPPLLNDVDDLDLARRLAYVKRLFFGEHAVECEQQTAIEHVEHNIEPLPALQAPEIVINPLPVQPAPELQAAAFAQPKHPAEATSTADPDMPEPDSEQALADEREMKLQARLIDNECRRQAGGFPRAVGGSHTPWGRRR